jgi:hypothetical protein
VAVRRNDLGHVVKFTKSQMWLSIDGAVAAAMAVARCAAGERNRSSYESADEEFDGWAYVARGLDRIVAEILALMSAATTPRSDMAPRRPPR